MLAGGETRHHAPQGVHYAADPLAGEPGTVAFLFPGQGSQSIDMTRELTLAFPEAREAFELADRVLADAYPQPLSRYIFPPPTFTEEEARIRHRELTDTHVAQAALGAAELAYVKVLDGLGVRPDMTAGHSYGELAALAAAGGLDDVTLLSLSEARGRLMSEAAAGEAGGMAAIDSAPETLAPLLESDSALVIANLNGPTQTVISGPRDSIDAAVRWCGERDLRARALPVACAFHSPHVAGAQRKFAAQLRQAEIDEPTLPVFSNTTGEPHDADPKKLVKVLAQHLAKPVQFVAEIEAMHDAGARVFVEVGPRAVLTGLSDQILRDREHLSVPIDRPGRTGLVQLLHCLAALASEGVPVAPARLFAGRDVERVNLRRLAAREQKLAPGTWEIDGGSARPAGEPAPILEPVPALTPPAASPPAASPPAASPARAPVAVAPRSQPAETRQHPVPKRTTEEPRPVSSPPNGHYAPPGGDRVADVMARYQHLMQQFLDTERAVMLGYLGAANGRPAAYAAPSLPTLAPLPAPPLPAPALPAPVALAPAPALARPAMPAPAPAPVQAAPVAAPAPVAPAPVAPAPAAAPVAAAPAPAVAAPVAAPAAAFEMSRAEIEAKLLDVVSERTGYPTDMLELDADLEGDLGIDSIKRVEVAGSFTADLDEDVRAGIDMEQLTGSRTLREVIEVIERGLQGATTEVAAVPFESAPAETERIGRFVVGTASAPAITARAGLAPRGAVIIIGDGTGLGEALAERLPGQAVVIPSSAVPCDEREAQELIEVLVKDQGGIRGLIHLPGDDAYGGLEALFLLVRAAAAQLHQAAAAGGAVVLSATRGTGTATAPTGFAKSLALEWPAVRVKAVHLADGTRDELVERLLVECDAGDGLVELAVDAAGRTKSSLVAAPLAQRPETLTLEPGAVVLVTGGARGITAESAIALAERYQPTLVLVGRTEPAPEPAATADLAPMDLRKALIEARRAAGEPLSPALVEADVRAILRGREVHDTIARIEQAGATAEYLACDVADADSFGALIDGVYDRHGRLDGVIHGAGVIEDRLIVDKSLDSLRRVLAAKSGAARTLAERLRPDGLRFLCLFSSVSGRFGNRGQADYAAASEALAGLARELDAAWPARVVAIDWGPWSGVGMASALEDEFTRRGVALIDVATGTRMLVEELTRGAAGETEVVIGAAKGLSPTGPDAGAVGGGSHAAPADAAPRLALLDGGRFVSAGEQVSFERALSVDHDRYLTDHRVDGKPVFPFAGAMELMASVASAAEPDRAFVGLEQIRLLKGITVPDGEQLPVQVSAKRKDSGVEVLITGERPHYRSVARFARNGGLGEPQTLDGLTDFPMAIADAYRDLLFHGPIFQGIAEIAGLDGRGATATLTPSAPSDCVAGADQSSWVIDPVLIDSALQVQVIWARLQWDMTLLPAEIAGYEFFDAPAPGEAVRLELRIRPESTAPMCHCDHWFYGADGRLLASLTDVVGVGSKALNRLAGAQA